MKFCMVTTFYPPFHFGGDATYVRSLAASLVGLGHEVSVVHCEDAFRLGAGGRENLSEVDDDGVHVHRLKSAVGPLSPLLTQQLGIPGLKSARLRQILAEDFDVVNFHNISLVGGPAILPMSRAPVTLYTLHEHWLLCPTHIFWKNRSAACDSRQCFRCSIRSGIPPQLWRYTSLLKNSLRAIDRFIAPSEYTADRHRELLQSDLPIDVIPLFSHLSPAAAIPASSGELSFVFVGRLTASKGIAQLLQSFARWPQYRLDVIGDGDMRQALEQRYGESPNIRFLGALPQRQLIDFYRSATALILPSLAPETFGLTVVEAFACGTPAIVRRAGGNHETIRNSEAGFVYNDEKGLLQALKGFAADPQLRVTLGKKARLAYERDYTAEKHVATYLELVDRLIHEKAQSG